MILLTSSPSFVSSNSPVNPYPVFHRIDSVSDNYSNPQYYFFLFSAVQTIPAGLFIARRTFFSSFLISFPSRHTSLSGATFIPIPAISPFTAYSFFLLSSGLPVSWNRFLHHSNIYLAEYFPFFYSSGVRVLFPCKAKGCYFNLFRIPSKSIKATVLFSCLPEHIAPYIASLSFNSIFNPISILTGLGHSLSTHQFADGFCILRWFFLILQLDFTVICAPSVASMAASSTPSLDRYFDKLHQKPVFSS